MEAYRIFVGHEVETSDGRTALVLESLIASNSVRVKWDDTGKEELILASKCIRARKRNTGADTEKAPTP